jgi:hypothetical protein
VFRRFTRNTRAFTTERLYLPTKLGGLGLKRLSDIVQLDKWATIQRMLRGNSHFHTVALGLVHQGFRKANIHPPKDTTTIYFPPAISQGRSVYLTSLLEWGWQNSVGFALGGHYEECGEDTLNRISEDLPIAVMARLRETNITSFSDIRV